MAYHDHAAKSLLAYSHSFVSTESIRWTIDQAGMSGQENSNDAAGAETHHQHMRRAIHLAWQGAVEDKAGACFGAVIVKNGVVVGEGYNRVGVDIDPTAHAEVVAIRNACKALGSPGLDGCVMYASAEPCYMCAAASYWARVSQVYYAAKTSDFVPLGACEFNDPFHGDEPALPTEARKGIPFVIMLNDESVAAMEKYVETGHVFHY